MNDFLHGIAAIIQQVTVYRERTSSKTSLTTACMWYGCRYAYKLAFFFGKLAMFLELTYQERI